MSSFSEWRKKKEKEGVKTTQPSVQTPVEQTEITSGGSTSFADWRKKKYAADSSVSNWARSSRDAITDLQSHLSSWSGADDEDYTNYQTRISEMLSLADGWRKQYAGNTEAVSYIDSVVDALSEAKKGAFDTKNYYSLWDTEKDYSDYWASQKDRTEKLSSDLSVIQRELDDLYAQRDEAKQIQHYLDGLRWQVNEGDGSAETQRAIASLEEQLKQYSDLDSTITQREQYYNQAKHLQDGEKLKSDALNAADFSEYAKKGADIENPTLWDAEKGPSIFGWKPFAEEVANEVTYSRDNWEGITMGGKGMEGNALYRYMSEDEVKIYNYYLAKEGKAKADEFLYSIEESLNARQAGVWADETAGNLALQYLLGASAGLDQFHSGVDAIFSDEDYINTSALQYASSMVREDLAETGPQILGSSLGQIGYDLINTTANMAPSILASTIISTVATPVAGAAFGSTAGAAIGATAGKLVGAGVLGASAGGNAYAEKLNAGYSKEQAAAYGKLVGASEAGLEYLIGGISKLGGTVTGKTIEAIANNIDNAVGRVAAKWGLSMFSEGFEEYLQEVMTPWYENIVFNMENDVQLLSEEALYSGLLGALSAGILEGRSTISGDRALAKQGEQLKRDGLSVERLKSLGQTFAADTVAYELAGKVDENSSAYTIARLFNEVNAQLSEQNKADIVKSLERKGYSTVHAKIVANQLAAAVDGAEFGAAQRYVLEHNPDIAKTFYDVVVNPNSTVNQRRVQSTTSLFDLANEQAQMYVQQKYAPTAMQKKTAEEYTAAATDSAKNMFASPAEDRPTSDVSAANYTPMSLEELSRRVAAAESMTATELAVAKAAKAEQDALGGLAVSKSGNTEQKSTGKEIGKLEIVSTEGKKLKLKTEDGKIVDAKDVSFRSKGEAMVYSAVLDMGVSPVVAQSIVDNYDGEDGMVYAADVKLAYQYGKMNFPKSYLEKLDIKSHQAEHAYKLGRSDAKVTMAKAKRTVKYKRGSLIYESELDEATLTARKKASIDGLKMLADLSSLNIHLFESTLTKDGFRFTDKDGAVIGANGVYKVGTNDIWVDINSGNFGQGLVIHTVAHEISHYIKEWSPAKWQAMADFLLEQYGEKGVPVHALLERQMAKVQKSKPHLKGNALMDAAYEELVSDALSEMLVDGRVAEKMQALKRKDKQLWEKIKEAIKDLLDRWGVIRKEYEKVMPEAAEAQFLRGMDDAFKKLQDMYAEAFADADANFSEAEETLAQSGIVVNATTDSASLLSVRDVLVDEDRAKVAKALASRFGVTETEALDWLSAETSLASLILNPKYSMYLDYEGDPNEVAIKQNSDYPQGTVDFSNICKKRREFTQVMNSVLRNFPSHVFAATDLAKIRTIMGQEGMTLPCGICYVEDRRQLDSIVAQDFIDSLKLYREGSKTRPDGKAFNANQLKGLQLTDGDTYVPNIYELVTLEGRNKLKEKNPNMEAAWVKFNNARGMQSVRLLTNEAEYKRQILKYNEKTVKSKNDHGGLRIYSFSDAEMFHLIDIVQVITDSAAVGLSLQGYTKVNEYAKAVKDTGEKLNRSLIPAGNLGYHMEGGKVVLDYDTVEGIDIHHKDFFDNKDNPNVGNIVIGINDVQIRAAMLSDFIDQIIPFHTGQSGDVLGEKGIAAWDNYKDFQSEVDISTGKKSAHQINIYTEVFQAAEKEGKPIQNKRQFVEKFLEVCKENGLKPRFAQFLNTDANGDYVYTEGYHKFLVDFKTFAQTEVGEYLPQMPVKPIFDNGYITGLLKAYVKEQQVKDAEVAKQMPKVIERITNEIIKPSEIKESARDAEAVEFSDSNTKFSIREEAPPKKVGVAYKVFLAKDGQLYPPMVANPGGEGTPVGVWLNADVGKAGPPSKSGRPQVQGGGKGTNSGKISLAFRPGWHLGDIPLAKQFARLNPETGNKELFPANFVWAECEYAMDVDYQEEAMSYGYTENGKFRHAYAGLPRLPADGYYRYRTNPNPDTVPWVITGAMRVKRILTDAETDAICRENGVEPMARQGGPINLADFGLNAGEVKLSARDIEQSFNIKAINNYVGVQKAVIETLTNEGFFDGDRNIVTNRASGMMVEITKDGIRETLGPGKRFETLPRVLKDLKLSTLRSLPEIIASAELDTDSVSDIHNQNSDLKYAYLKSDATVDGTRYEVTVTVRKSRQKNKFWVHEVRAEKKKQGLSSSGDVNPDQEYNKALVSEDRVTQPEGSVKEKLSDRDTAPTFYSHMARVVDDVKQEKLGAASVVSMLRGKGVKAEEIKWSGIEDWLAGKKSVTKAELQEFIAGSMLQIEEETLHDEDDPYTEEEQAQIAKFEAERETIVEQLKSEWKRIVGTDLPITNFGAGLEHSVVDKLLDAHLAVKNKSEAGYKYRAAKAALQRVIEDSEDDFGYDTSRQAFREAVRNPKGFMDSFELTSFQKGVFRDFIKAKEAYSKVEGIPMDDQKALIAIAASADRFNSRISKVKSEHRAKEAKRRTKWGQYKLGGGSNYRELLFKMPGSDYSNDAMYTHWENRYGVLAHARVQDLRINGKWALFVEELQSDWHNSGHKDGYRKPGAEDKQALSWKMEQYTEEFFASEIAGVIEDKISAIGYEGAGVSMILNYLLDSNTTESTLGMLRRKGVTFTESEVSQLMEYVHSYEDLYHQWENAPSEVTAPEAPFSKNYHEFVMKRLLRMAAEGGYDSIGWTTKDIQMDRWNPGRKTNAEMGVKAKDQNAVAFERAYTIEYDQGIPKFMGDYGKNWGAKVERSEVGGETVWSMTIPDAMKQSVLYEGQALYSERDIDSVSNRDLLAGAFMDVAQSDIERGKIAEYQKKVQQLNEQEQKLAEIRKELKDLSFSSGPRDNAKISKLRDEATKTANRISNLDKTLLRLEASKPLMAVLEREKNLAYSRASQKWADRMEKARTGRDAAEMRRKIKAFKGKLEKSLLNPTDRVYVPVDLVNAMVDVCSLIDIDTDLYHADGSVNKAQEKRNLTKEKLQNLKDEYEKLKTHSDPIYQGEFDELVYTYLGELRDKFSGKPLKEMSLDALTELYETLRAIDETLRDARKLIGWGDAESVYEAGDAIAAEQKEITKGLKNGQRSAVQKARDASLNMSLSPVRNVERMSGYHDDSYLLKLFKKFEQGVRKKNKFVMEAYKSFEHLTSGKEYEDAMYTEVGGKKYEDIHGRKFGISKMQMMQAILSFERESANHMNHIQSGGFTFADLDMLRKGKLRDAISEEHSHRVPNAVDLVSEFSKLLENDKWCQDYMAAARKFFNGTAKDAINETSIALKHRIIAKDKSYIPFEVDKNFVVREISAENDIQQTINSYGMLKSIKDGAPQPLIVTGLNNILDRHIDQVGNVYGLAIEVRNFNKVWNVRTMDAVGSDPTVKAAIQRNWGVEGVKHIEQAVQDIQGPRHSEQSALYKKVKSGYIGATFLLNLSVVTKQIGSLYSATSMLKWRGPMRQLGNLLYTMVNHKVISAEVDKYTATAWMRRQGLSDAEVHTFMTEGKKTLVGRLTSKLPAVLNPGKWITAMDHAVALSLWRYAKQDTAKRTGLTGEELLKAAAEFYDEVIENTQSMTDMLHRPEIQKRSDILSESFAMFKTDLYQMAGQLQVTAGRFAANKTKENGKALGRTVYAIAMSAMWAQLMTTVFALLRYKVNPYRDDEDEELTAESWLKRQSFALAGDLMGYIMPIFGSETVGFFESIMYGESEEFVDSIALTAINDLYDTMTTVATAIKDGEMPEPAQMKKLVVKSLQVFGVPANNIIRTYEAIHLHAKDIANGEFLSFEAGVDRTAGQHIHRIIEAMSEGKTDVAIGLYEEAVEETAGDDYSEDEMKSAKSSLKTALGNKFKGGEITESQAIDVLTKCFGYERDEARADVQYWTFKRDYPDTFVEDSWFDKYYEDIADSGISLKLYVDYRNQVKGIDGEGKKKRRMDVIHSLPLSVAQKDALYYSEGWAASTIYEAPWH